MTYVFGKHEQDSDDSELVGSRRLKKSEITLHHQQGVFRCNRNLFVVLASLCFAASLYAHAILLSSKPAFASSIRGPNVSIELRFNSRIDQKRSHLTLISATGAQRTLAIDVGASPDLLISNVKDVSKGAYVLQWQVLAVDGHITRGQVRFTVE